VARILMRHLRKVEDGQLKEGPPMPKDVRVTWLEKEQFVGVDETNHAVVISSQSEGNGTGMNPSSLLLVSLGSCTSYDVVNILHKKRQPLTGLEVRVSAEQDQEPPWRFLKIHVHYILRGRGLQDKAVYDAIRLSEEKYCSVSGTLCDVVEITYDYEIVEASPPL
jgi:putative redox protein